MSYSYNSGYGAPPPQQQAGYQQYGQYSYTGGEGYPPTSGYGMPQPQGASCQGQEQHMQSNYGPPPNQAYQYSQGQVYAPSLPQDAQPLHAPLPVQPQASVRPSVSTWSEAPDTAQQYDRAQAVKPTATTSESSRSLSDKFSALLHRRHSNSSSSSNDDEEKKKHKNKFATVPKFDPRDGPYPFSAFCARNNPELIVLSIVDAGEGHDLLVGPNQDTDHPAYKIEYNGESDFEVYRCELPALNADKSEFVVSCKQKENDAGNINSRLKLKFPWAKWDFEIFNEWWSSDVGLLEGKSDMKWYLLEQMNTYNDGKFVARCFDTTTPSMPTVASFFMDDHDFGKLEVVARLIKTQEQLDEIVTISFGVMNYLREYVRDNPDGKSTDNVRQPNKK